RVAVRQVDRSHSQNAGFRGHQRLEEAGVIVLRVARKPGRDLVERQLRQDGDAIEGFLTVHGYVVAEALQWLPRKGLVDALGLLQADDVGLSCREPSDEPVETLLDGVDVPGGDQHDGHSSLAYAVDHARVHRPVKGWN